jgi:anti-sigma regulatory factor (Ser/Thr protein kinase)
VTTTPHPAGTVQPEQPLQLEVPRDTAHLATARLFAAAVGRHFGADAEAIEDLKLGVSEAVAAAAEDDSDSDTTRIAVRPEGDTALSVDVGWSRPKAADAADAPVATEVAIGLAVVTGLFPDAEVTDEGGSMCVRFTAPLRTSAAAEEAAPG